MIEWCKKKEKEDNGAALYMEEFMHEERNNDKLSYPTFNLRDPRYLMCSLEDS